MQHYKDQTSNKMTRALCASQLETNTLNISGTDLYLNFLRFQLSKTKNKKELPNIKSKPLVWWQTAPDYDTLKH